jgi:hypothetical protein
MKQISGGGRANGKEKRKGYRKMSSLSEEESRDFEKNWQLLLSKT